MTTDGDAKKALVCLIAGLLRDCNHVAVGAASPIPGAAALLAKAAWGSPRYVNILGSVANNFFTGGGGELFDCAAQGRIDAFFLGGGQIDGKANINLMGRGDYPTQNPRWPGTFGSAYLYFLVPKVILFRDEHSRRTLVDKVDFISAPGTSDAKTYRKGGPYGLVTNKAFLRYGMEAAAARWSTKAISSGRLAPRRRKRTARVGPTGLSRTWPFSASARKRSASALYPCTREAHSRMCWTTPASASTMQRRRPIP